MPEKQTIQRARAKKRAGRAPSTQAGELVREEIEHVRQGKHGARSTKQAIAIGLSKARRAGVPLKPKRGASASERRKQERDLEVGRGAPKRAPSKRRGRAVRRALQREGRSAASSEALGRQARRAAGARTAADRSAAAKKAARTKSPEQRRAAARKAAATRARRAAGASH